MRFDVSDNLLLIATCVGLYISYYTIKNTLQDIKDATRVPDPVPTQPKTRQLDPNAEDSIDEKTLRTLSKSANFEVRNAAIKIFIARACRPETRKGLLRDLQSLNPERRDRAINGIWLLLYGVDLNDFEGNKKRQRAFQNKETYESIIRALLSVLPEHRRWAKGKESGRWAVEAPPSPVRPIRRPPHELSLINMLTLLLVSGQHSFNEKGNKFNPIASALDAGLVTKWLAKYPFPCAIWEYGHGNFKKSDVVSLFESNAYASDDHLMSGLISLLTKSPRGMKELRRAGLTTSTFKEDVKPMRRRRSWERLDDEVDVLMVGGEDTAGISRWTTIDATADGPRPRSLDRSREEDRIRRRHREAIVVADRGEPLSRDNILQRQDSEVGITPVVFLDSDWAEEDETHMDLSDDDSMPSLEDVQSEPIDPRVGESPHSFRRRFSERLRQGFRSFPPTQQDQSSHESEASPNEAGPVSPRLNADGVDEESFSDGWGGPHHAGNSYDVPD